MPTHKVKNGYKWGKVEKFIRQKNLLIDKEELYMQMVGIKKETSECMKKTTTIKLTENQLRDIITESINQILLEKRGINSDKLYNIIKQHGGLAHGNNGVFDLNNMTDNDIIGVVDYNMLCHINDLGQKEWSKRNGIKLGVGDVISDLELNDGQYILAILRGGNFDKIGGVNRDKSSSDFEILNQKHLDRERNKSQKAYKWHNSDAEDLFKNPYFRKGSGNWSSSEKKQAMNNVRNGKRWFDDKK